MALPGRYAGWLSFEGTTEVIPGVPTGSVRNSVLFL